MTKTSNLLNTNSSSYEARLIIKEFSKPIFLNKFFNNKDFLINIDPQNVDRNFDLVEFYRDSWYHCPEKFCLDFYEEHNYYPIILMVNNIGSRFSFLPQNLVTPYIIAPKKKAIIEVLNMRSL